MTGLLLDTHVWLWYLTGSDRLPAGLRKAIGATAAERWLSPISVWELGWLVRAGRIRLHDDDTYRGWCERALAALPVNEATVSAEVSITAQEMRLGHRDPADHLIAATALVYDLTLLTLDGRLTRISGLKTKSR